MNIRSMTATFGTLQNATMQMHEGMNLRTLPNEAGKSTWVAFVTAMLYGVPTNERARKDGIPMKTRYQPWNGAPMEGVMELTWQDRPLRISRSSSQRGPMAEFQATWQDTGEAVSGMTGDNCGQMLLGVPRAVFERSALIRQNSMAVDQSPEMEQQLDALVTSGEAASSYTRVNRTLKDWQNQRQYHKSGELPELLARREQLQAQLDEAAASREATDAEHAQLEALLAQRQQLQEQIRQAAGAAGMEQPLAEAKAEAERAERAASALREQVLPPLNEIDMMLQNLGAIEKDAQALASAPRAEDGVTGGVKLAVFQGLSREEAAEKAEADAAAYRKLRGKATREKLSPLVSILAFVLAILSILILRVTVSYVISALLVVAGALYLILHKLGAKDSAQVQADAILAAYGVDDGEGIYDAAQAYIESQRNRQTADAGYTASKAELSLRVSAIRKAVSPLGRSDSIRGCRDTLQAARMRRIKLDRAENEARQAKAVYEKMLSSSSDEVPSEALDGLDAELAALEQRIDQLRNSVSMEQGRVAGLGAPVQIETELAQVNEQISRVQQELMAIEMAQDALSEAASELQSRIFPQLTQPASRYISRMTGGRYDQVIVDRELNISAHPAQGAADRRILQLSDGTADQLYLALRLAICDAVLPKQAPIVLDDALLSFDDERLGEAMKLLRQIAAERQVLLFSCTGREVRWSKNHPGA